MADDAIGGTPLPGSRKRRAGRNDDDGGSVELSVPRVAIVLLGILAVAVLGLAGSMVVLVSQTQTLNDNVDRMRNETVRMGNNLQDLDTQVTNIQSTFQHQDMAGVVLQLGHMERDLTNIASCLDSIVHGYRSC